MRLLLILALIVSALAMANPASAITGERTADCHAMAGDAGPGTARHAPDDLPPALHACPGCAFLAAAAPTAKVTVRALVPQGSAAFVARPSRANPPIAPPPKAA